MWIKVTPNNHLNTKCGTFALTQNNMNGIAALALHMQLQIEPISRHIWCVIFDTTNLHRYSNHTNISTIQMVANDCDADTTHFWYDILFLFILHKTRQTKIHPRYGKCSATCLPAWFPFRFHRLEWPTVHGRRIPFWWHSDSSNPKSGF